MVRLVALGVARPVGVVLLSLALVAGAMLYARSHFAMTTDTAALISPDIDWRRNEKAVERAFPQLSDALLIVVDGATPELAESAAAKLTEVLAADSARFRTVTRPDGGAFFDREGLLFGSPAEVKASTAALIEAQPLLGPLAADPSLRGVTGALGTMLTGVETGNVPLSRIERPMAAMADALDARTAGKPAHFSWQDLFAKPGSGDAPPRRRLILAQPRLDFGALQPGEAGVSAIERQAKALGLDNVPRRARADDRRSAACGRGIRDAGGEYRLCRPGDGRGDAADTVVRHAIGEDRARYRGDHPCRAGRHDRGRSGGSRRTEPHFGGVHSAVRRAGGRFRHPDRGALQCRTAGRGGDGSGARTCRNRAWGTARARGGGGVPGFGAFLPTDYIGIAELGIIAGLGMIVALLASVTVLPALLMLLGPGAPRREVGFAAAAPVDRWLATHRRAVLWAFGLSMLGSVALLPLVQFDFNPLHLRNPDAPAMRTLADLMRDPLRTPNTINVLAANPGAAGTLAARLAALPEVAEAVSVDSFVPTDQPEKLAVVEDAALLLDAAINPFDTLPPPGDAETVSALSGVATRLRAAAGAHPGPAAQQAMRLAGGFERLARAPAPARRQAEAMFVEPLAVMLNQVRSALQAEAVTRATLPPEIAGNWVAADGRALVQVFPKGDSNDNAVLRRFTRAVRTLAPTASGLPVATQEAAGTVAWAFVEAGLLALVLIGGLLFAVLRDVREVAFTLAPVVLSGFLTLGSCVLIGQPINFANIIAFPLLFGVGVAFHIYFVMAWRSGATDLLQSSLARAVLFSALATGSAFGSLWLSHHPGTASMGKILMISLAWTLVCALIFEPALLGPPRKGKQR